MKVVDVVAVYWIISASIKKYPDEGNPEVEATETGVVDTFVMFADKVVTPS